MKVTFIRHGKTAGNMLRRYIGKTDEPLCKEGRADAEMCEKDFSLKVVYVTPLKRTQETARILFPNAEQIIVDDFCEMNFGVFENRSADEMANDAAYRAWVEGKCVGKCPGGESMSEFCKRVVSAFKKNFGNLSDDAVIVAHGGVIMALLSAFSKGNNTFYDWYVPNLGKYSATVLFVDNKLFLTDIVKQTPTV